MTNLQTILETAGESILMAFGTRPQMIKTCEELGELITQLCKKLNGSPTTNEQIVDEIADTLIMIMQMRLVYGKSAVDERVMFKLDRTLERIRTQVQKHVQENVCVTTQVDVCGVAHGDIMKGQICDVNLNTGAIVAKRDFGVLD